jgi:two-component system nitrogen regulation response regulator NtrX
MLLDVLLPGTDGITLLRRLQERGSELPVIMMSGHATIQTAVDATKLGAIDFIEKPLKVERVLLSMENGLRMHRLRAENTRLREALAPADEIIGSSKAITKLRDEIARAAPTDARVLITGENGTGKELVARALHAGSMRSERPFITVNCAAIPAELLESELFGHERGAFTGAVATRRGKFELAQRGTLLLDEIGDMNPTTQAKLLRVLEEGELERLGGETSVAIDVRVLSSTNQDLGRLLQNGGFREDLFHRLKVVPIHIPPLREHAEDVDELARHYLTHFCEANGRWPKRLTDGALAALRSYGWPGNVRELKNLMERLVIMVDSLEIGSESIQPLLGVAADTAEDSGEDAPLAERLEAFERRLVARALEAARGNVAEAGRSLGLDRANLHRKIKRLGLDR